MNQPSADMFENEHEEHDEREEDKDGNEDHDKQEYDEENKGHAQQDTYKEHTGIEHRTRACAAVASPACLRQKRLKVIC